jgi:hypothetical protein
MKKQLKYLLAAGLAFCLSCSTASAPASKAPGAPPATQPLPLRALLIGGGPTREDSQAGIEGNARYVASLLKPPQLRLLWNDGKKSTPSVAVLEEASRDHQLAQLALAFALEEESPGQPVEYRAPKLPRLDGAASKENIAREIKTLGASVKAGESALLYFTGHGSPGTLKTKAGEEPDYDNTLYSLWGERDLSVREVAPMISAIPARTPLVVVAVQCHSGGFGNLLFESGDSKRPALARDFCGFFAATGDRQSSGCTPDVDEAGYEDFTTHFFGALSNRGRAGRRVATADFDGDRRVSMLEAFAYASLHDRSIDVPTCTSSVFLAALYEPQRSWYDWKFSRLEARATPWQKAMLRGLSRRLDLRGEARLSDAARQAWALSEFLSGDSESEGQPSANAREPWPDSVVEQGEALREDVLERWSRLKQPDGSPSYQSARDEAFKYVRAHPTLWRELAEHIERENKRSDAAEVREAMLWRFVGACFSLIAEEQLEKRGTGAQKTAFARLRKSEGRSLFK